MSEHTRATVHTIATAAVAGIWMYHGIVPKLLIKDPDETMPLERAGLSPEAAQALVRATAIGEIAFAGVLVARNQKRWPWILTAVSMPVLAAVAVLGDRKLAGRSFNPVTLNAAMAALALIGAATTED